MRDILRKLKPKLKKSDAVERCGLILADGSVFQLENVHANPAVGFAMAGAELLKHEADLFGTWHTHLSGSSILSQDDYDGFRNWPGLTHFIIASEGARAYRVEDDIIREVDLAAD